MEWLNALLMILGFNLGFIAGAWWKANFYEQQCKECREKEYKIFIRNVSEDIERKE